MCMYTASETDIKMGGKRIEPVRNLEGKQQRYARVHVSHPFTSIDHRLMIRTTAIQSNEVNFFQNCTKRLRGFFNDFAVTGSVL